MSPDLRPIDIILRLADMHKTLADVDRLYGLAQGAAKQATRRPHNKGEEAISHMLNTAPHLIWPSRYDASGKRLSPQPSKNYIVKKQFRGVKNNKRSEQGAVA